MKIAFAALAGLVALSAAPLSAATYSADALLSVTLLSVTDESGSDASGDLVFEAWGEVEEDSSTSGDGMATVATSLVPPLDPSVPLLLGVGDTLSFGASTSGSASSGFAWSYGLSSAFVSLTSLSTDADITANFEISFAISASVSDQPSIYDYSFAAVLAELGEDFAYEEVEAWLEQPFDSASDSIPYAYTLFPGEVVEGTLGAVAEGSVSTIPLPASAVGLVGGLALLGLVGVRRRNR
jgi:hypothetical protein